MPSIPTFRRFLPIELRHLYYAANKGFWICVATNARLPRLEVADRLNDAGVAVYNIAVDAREEKPGLTKALVPIQRQIDYLPRK